MCTPTDFVGAQDAEGKRPLRLVLLMQVSQEWFLKSGKVDDRGTIRQCVGSCHFAGGPAEGIPNLGGRDAVGQVVRRKACDSLDGGRNFRS